MGNEKNGRTFTLEDIEKVFGVERSKANRWRRQGYVSPEIGKTFGQKGRPSEINFTPDQVMKVALIDVLRRDGWTMSEVRDALTSPTWRTDHADLLGKFVNIITLLADRPQE